jgi:hypothetical protein
MKNCYILCYFLVIYTLTIVISWRLPLPTGVFLKKSILKNEMSKISGSSLVPTNEPSASLKPCSSNLLSFSKGRRLFSSSQLFSSSSSSSSVSTIPQDSSSHEVDDAASADQRLLLPQHPDLVQGQLANGFTYYILPNSNPPGRFEAHLEVFFLCGFSSFFFVAYPLSAAFAHLFAFPSACLSFLPILVLISHQILSGSIHEMDHQQGMAHLLEHVSYMGSSARQLISGTGSRTNAYTDFHHTVFFSSCPVETPSDKTFYGKKPMLPLALDALVDVMRSPLEVDRIEKEKNAVLSEASMVNKMEYRVECQILSTLHEENRLCKRFPIGKEALIRSWKQEDLKEYHSMHYVPDNVILYIVGMLKGCFSPLSFFLFLFLLVEFRFLFT